MISSTMMWLLTIFYFALAVVAIFESKIPLSLYWLGAALLTVGVSMMGHKG
jgi:hypothetical protein